MRGFIGAIPKGIKQKPPFYVHKKTAGEGGSGGFHLYCLKSAPYAKIPITVTGGNIVGHK